MKKLFLIALSASLLTACNNSGESAESKKDSAVEAIDSTKDAKKDSIDQHMDSLMEKTEKTYEKTDSANQAIADSAKNSK